MNRLGLPLPLTPLSGLYRALQREARILRYGALILVGALSAATYDRPTRHATAHALCAAGWHVLPGYALLSILVAAVLTHIIATTAASYDLSHLALEAVVRVFVVELIPLAAALFVAVRSGLDAMTRLADLRAAGLAASDTLLLQRHVVPAVVGNAVAVVALSVASGVLALGVAYLVVYGFSPWGLAGFAHLVGQAFDPVTAPIFALKILLFGLAVAIAPATVVLETPRSAAAGGEMRIMARLLLMLVLIEAAALALRDI